MMLALIIVMVLIGGAVVTALLRITDELRGIGGDLNRIAVTLQEKMPGAAEMAEELDKGSAALEQVIEGAKTAKTTTKRRSPHA